MHFISIKSKIVFYSSLCLLFLGASIIVYAGLNIRASAIRKAYDRIGFIAQDRAQHVQMKLNASIINLSTLATILDKARNPLNPISVEREEVDFLLRSILKSDRCVAGTYTCWPPNGFDNRDGHYINEPGHDETGRFAPYWYRNTNGILEVQPVAGQDKGRSQACAIFHRKKAPLFISDPHLKTINRRDISVVSFVIPVNLKKKYPGVVGMDINCHSLQYLTRVSGTEAETGQILILNSNKKIFEITDKPNLIGRDVTSLPEYRDVDFHKMLTRESFVASSKHRLQFFAPVEFANLKPWWTIVSLSRDTITAEARSLTKSLVLTGMGCMIISILILQLFSSRIVRSLKLLRAGAEHIRHGNYSQVIEGVNTHDEIGELASAFRTMSAEIQKKRG